MDATDPRSLKLLVVGVGGQGVLTLARVIGEAALLEDLEVNVGQLHGMSQRGGSVSSTVLVGPGTTSFIADGEADVVVGLEPLEALRARPRMSGRTTVVVNLARVVPPTLARQGEAYPPLEEILAGIREVAPEVAVVDAARLATEAGDVRAVNIVMLGALAGRQLLPLAEASVRQALGALGRGRHDEVNQRAFALGKEAA